jgi:ABC-2 type transport system ATP-binding protein
VTIFLTTHDMAEAERLCDSVAVIRDGKLITVGSPELLGARHSGPRLDFLGTGFSEAIVERLRTHAVVLSAELTEGHLTIELREDVSAAGLVRLVVESGAQVEEVRRSQAGLEEVFMTLMSETPS